MLRQYVGIDTNKSFKKLVGVSCGFGKVRHPLPITAVLPYMSSEGRGVGVESSVG